MDLKELSKPFPADDIEWRIGRAGENDKGVWAMALAYITARAIHDRLDEVCGPENWELRYATHHAGTICEIGILVGEQWVTKAGGSDDTDIESFKGGLSSAEKRAGVPWGIGRYLYKLTETFVETSTTKQKGWKYQAKGKKHPAFYWKIPSMPQWALPEGSKTTQKPPKRTAAPPEKKAPQTGSRSATDAQMNQLRGMFKNDGIVKEDAQRFMDWVERAEPLSQDSAREFITQFAQYKDAWIEHCLEGGE